MSATASGSNAQPNGSAKSRDHNQGNQDRKYTPQQKAEVIRIRRCGPTAFYEILSVEKTASEGEIKKAYRKISLLTHPDKNGYEGADEAFKMVSRAFQILSDVDKKSRYDQFGGDPDNRFSSSGAGASSPFSGFGRSPGARAQAFDAEISPEELFNQFFGGGGFGGGFGGFAGPQFVFNMGGGPGFTVHRMGGQTPRRRPREAGAAEPPPSGLAALTQLLPLLLLFILPLLSSLFTGAGSSGPSYRFDSAIRPHTQLRVSSTFNINYFVDPSEVAGFKARDFNSLDTRVEKDYIQQYRHQCEAEMHHKQREITEATGFFFTDEERLRRARELPLVGCKRLEQLQQQQYQRRS